MSNCARECNIGQRNTQLDGLRGYAAVNVAIFHTILAVDPSLVQRVVYGNFSDLRDNSDWCAKIILRLFSGETAVFVFFVLSGAVLFQSLMRHQLPVGPMAVRFAVRRAFRIYPALIGCLVFTAVAYAAAGQPLSWQAFWTNLSLYDFPINGATWTLNVEMVAVAFVFAVYLGWRSLGLAGMVAAMLLVWAFFDYAAPPFGITFRGFWIYFVLGMLIPTRVGKLAVAHFPSWSIWPVLFLAIFFKGAVQQLARALSSQCYFITKAPHSGAG